MTESKRAELIEKKLEESFEDLGKLEYCDASKETGNDKLAEAFRELEAQERVGRIESSDQILDSETPRRLGEIRSLNELDESLKQCPERRIQRSFENDYQKAKAYLESEEATEHEKAADEGVDSARPKLVEDMEKRENRRRFVEDHGGPP